MAVHLKLLSAFIAKESDYGSLGTLLEAVENLKSLFMCNQSVLAVLVCILEIVVFSFESTCINDICVYLYIHVGICLQLMFNSLHPAPNL